MDKNNEMRVTIDVYIFYDDGLGKAVANLSGTESVIRSFVGSVSVYELFQQATMDYNQRRAEEQEEDET